MMQPHPTKDRLMNDSPTGKTPRKRPELLLGALALFGAAAALVALGVRGITAQGAEPAGTAAASLFEEPQTEKPAATSQHIPQNVQEAIGYTGIVIYYTDAAGEATAPQETHPTQPTAKPTVSYPVNLNTATQAQLETLPGIGEVKAQAILVWRAAHGGFSSVNQLTEIEGIGEKTLETLLPYIIVN